MKAKIFTPDQRKHAVNLSLRIPMAEAAKQIGCSVQSLSNWRKIHFLSHDPKDLPQNIEQVKNNLTVLKLLINQVDRDCNSLLDSIGKA